jgi:hypothetical protein
MRRAVLPLGAALLAAALFAAGTPAADRAAPACMKRGLVVWLNTQSNGAAGSFYYRLEFTNLSGRACSLHGYPGVSGVDLAGRGLGSPAGRNPSRIRTITLANGATGNAVLRIVVVGNFPPARCRQTSAAGLRVYPPNQRALKLVPFPFRACARTGTRYLFVGTLSNGAGSP